METFGGYDCEFVKQPTSAFQTECPICNLILRDPYQSKCCGISFCHTCSEQIQDKHKPCPTCREVNFEVFPNKGLKRSLNQLHIFCTHSKAGCRWTGELGELQNHLRESVHSGESGIFSLWIMVLFLVSVNLWPVWIGIIALKCYTLVTQNWTNS